MKINEKDEVKVQTEDRIETDEILTDIEEKEEELSKYIVIPDVTITRRSVKKSGKVYKDYFVNGSLRGVPVQVRVRPSKDSSGFTDVNNYTILDIVFGDAAKVMFAVQSYRRRDNATNRVVTGFTYHAYERDKESGEEWSAPLRFETSSDKAIISKLIEIANRKYELGLTL